MSNVPICDCCFVNEATIYWGSVTQNDSTHDLGVCEDCHRLATPNEHGRPVITVEQETISEKEEEGIKKVLWLDQQPTMIEELPPEDAEDDIHDAEVDLHLPGASDDEVESMKKDMLDPAIFGDRTITIEVEEDDGDTD